MRMPIPLLLAGGLFSTAAQGQTCLGQVAFAHGGISLSSEAEFRDGSTALLGGIGVGRSRGFFGGPALGFVSGEGVTGFVVTGLIARELAKPVVGRLELCPLAALRFQFGPTGYYERNYIIGGVLGYPILASRQGPRILVNGGFQAAYQQNGFNEDFEEAVLSGGGGEFDHHEWYGLLNAGMSFIFASRFSLAPQIRIPVGYGGRDISFALRAALNIGKAK